MSVTKQRKSTENRYVPKRFWFSWISRRKFRSKKKLPEPSVPVEVRKVGYGKENYFANNREYNSAQVKQLPFEVCLASTFCEARWSTDYTVKGFPSTALLCHEKQTGVSCYAVLKALDMGIPVYMSRMTKGLIGYDDLPDELFLFMDDMDIKTAYERSLTMDRAAISQRYREIYSLERLVNRVGELLELLEPG